MAVATTELPEWVDGPGFCEWFKRRVELTNREAQLGHHARRFQDWERGCTASVYTVDEVLVKFDIHLHELPEDLYRYDAPRKHVSPFPEKTKRRARELAKQGWAQTEIARELGCGARSVHNWLKEAA